LGLLEGPDRTRRRFHAAALDVLDGQITKRRSFALFLRTSAQRVSQYCSLAFQK